MPVRFFLVKKLEYLYCLCECLFNHKNYIDIQLITCEMSGLGPGGRQFESGRPDKKTSTLGGFFVMSYSVYILFSKFCQKFYTGQTQDFDNRIIEHNAGETKSLKSCLPWTLI